jgi:16S rRNA (adenine(1408)-N(1))-methyltransferase
VVDLGTGDGAAILAAARRAPDRAYLGIDADASRMREASRHAARKPARGGLPNAWFVVTAAEKLPSELDDRADMLSVTLPWGSLLRGALGPEPWFEEATRRLLRSGGELRLLLSVTARDGAPPRELDERAATDLAHRYEAAGWCVTEDRPATTADVSESGSSWARRLGIPARRTAWVLRARPPQARSSAA